jgi:hypothetical protein
MLVFTGRSAAAAATTGGPRGWLSVRHSLGLEAALVVTLYGVYEPASGPGRRQHQSLDNRTRLFVLIMGANPDLERVALVAAGGRPVENRVIGHQELDPRAPVEYA